MERIDAHFHVLGDDPGTVALLGELGIRALNVCVAHDGWSGSVRPGFRALSRAHPDRYAWCTTFDLPDYTVPDGEYQRSVTAGLARDLRDGAVAVKAWKHIGMELRRRDGSFAMVDDGVFTPVFEFLENEGVPLLTHIGEPLACWQPLDTPSAHAGYYRSHPEWHFHGRPGVPAHAELIRARDQVLARHPKLRVVGAHLGSLEYDVTEVGARLERFPGFAVDLSARLGDLMLQDREKVRGFFIRYQDRLLFGTDLVSTRPLSSLESAERDRIHGTIRSSYETWFRYLESDEIVHTGAQATQGLDLPRDVVEKVCSANARVWYPRLAQQPAP